MKLIIKPMLAVLSACIMLFALAATAKEDISGYKIQYLKSCDVIQEIPMNHNQVAAYKALQSESRKMQSIEAPTLHSNDEIDDLTAQINELTPLIHQENENTITINKTVLSKQKKLTQKLEKLIDKMQPHYTALSEQGEVISQKAKVFEASIAQSKPALDYDHVRIISPEKKGRNFRCYSSL